MIRRTLSPSSLLFASVSAILGSGWLFAAYYTAVQAGPASTIAWLIGGLAIIIVAFVFAELSAMIPVMGSSSRVPHYTHGTIVSFMFAWLIWLSYMAMAPTETQAVIQYLNFFFPSLTRHDGGLAQNGYILATTIMLLICFINAYSLRWLMRANTILTIIKIIIPVFISIVIISLFFTPAHVLHAGHSRYLPFGMHGVMSAITTGGIIFAFNGFKQACEMAGEAKNPSKSLPLAVIGSVVLTLVIYLLLQVAFFSSLTPQNLSMGWAHIQMPHDNSPFAGILYQSHLEWMLGLLYIGAIIGPIAAGLMYTSSASRSLFAQSKNGYLPLWLEHLNKTGVPIYAIIVNFAVGMMMFAPLPGWNKMISFLTSLMGLTYAIGPVCLSSLRKNCPELERPFKLPFATAWSFVAFYICTLITYWSGWSIISKLGIALAAGFIVLMAYHKLSERGQKIKFNWKPSIWLWPYFLGVTLISYLGNYGNGTGTITFGWDFVVIAIFCAFILWLATRFTLPADETRQFIKELNLDEKLQHD